MVLLSLGPFGDRSYIQSQRTRGLHHAELLAHQVVANLAEGLVVHHCGAPSERSPWQAQTKLTTAGAGVMVALWGGQMVLTWAGVASLSS